MIVAYVRKHAYYWVIGERANCGRDRDNASDFVHTAL